MSPFYAVLSGLRGVSFSNEGGWHHAKFLSTIDRETVPELDLHLIVDNYATHKHPKVQGLFMGVDAELDIHAV